jgi:hypothetical protein
MLGMGALTACNDKLELQNPNQPTSGTFGSTADELNEAVTACYHHIRMEGTFARVGYTLDMCRGDEVWNVAQSWGHLGADNLNASSQDDVVCMWIWRDWNYVINASNFVISKCGSDNNALSETMKRIKGQALFTRALSFYTLANYYQNPPLTTNYADYETMDKLYVYNWSQGDADGTAQYDRVLDQAEADFKEAMTLLPKRDEGGEWAKGRATCGSAAGYYARTLMQRHKYAEALEVLKDILSTSDGGNQKYGTYKLMANYGDNFREGSAYENNAESLFEVQFLDYGTQGTVDEWTPVNINKDATQGHAVESNFGPEHLGSWQDLSASPWLYNLFKSEKTKNGKLDPRLYWTIGTYETDWEGFEYGNKCYQEDAPSDPEKAVVTNAVNGGLPPAKWTNFRTGLYNSIVVGLRCGINLRLMRYSDVLLRAAECENEVNGPTQQAIDWINKVRSRANLADLQLADFADADALFEQIANVERPKEFGCETGRGFDLIRWGFFYDEGRLQQLKEHGVFNLHASEYATAKDAAVAAGMSEADAAKEASKVNRKHLKDVLVYGEEGVSSTFDKFQPGHEYFPIYQNYLNDNPNLRGNSANRNSDNSAYFFGKGWKVHPVVK